MKRIPDNKLSEFESILSKMSLELCCTTALPVIGVRWRDVTKAVRSNRLSMTPKSLAKVMRKFVAANIDEEDMDDILAILRLKVVAMSTSRVWYTATLSEELFEAEPVASKISMLPTRVLHAAQRIVRVRNSRPEVHSVNMENLVYLSLRAAGGRGAPLFVAAPPSEPIAFFSSLASKHLVQSVVEGLGYKKYSNAQLFGPDITSLLRIIDRPWNTNVLALAAPPKYEPAPTITKTGIDYTNKEYNRTYIDNLLGPDPPLLNHLDVRSEKPFYDSTILDGNFKVSLALRSDDVALTLKSWVVNKILSPTSDLLNVFHQMKSNSLTFVTREE